MSDDAPVTFLSDDGRVLVARDFRQYRKRSDRIAALVRSLFADASVKGSHR